MKRKKVVKRWTVYFPVICSEIYTNVIADTEAEAIEKVRIGEAQCIGEEVTGKELLGRRAELQEQPEKKQSR